MGDGEDLQLVNHRDNSQVSLSLTLLQYPNILVTMILTAGWCHQSHAPSSQSAPSITEKSCLARSSASLKMAYSLWTSFLGPTMSHQLFVYLSISILPGLTVF